MALAAGAAMPDRASAGFLDFLFNGGPAQRTPQANTFDPFGLNPAPPPATAPAAPRADAGRTTGYCVRGCDGRYFPVQARGGMSPAQVCQAFCPASTTKVYFGSTIDGAIAATGERYPDSDNAYAYRKALKADCTCNGRDPTGLAPIDISLDSTLRPGDVIATADGLVAYSGGRGGGTADFTPVASYPGLTAEVRAKLGVMKVTPISADLSDSSAAAPTDAPRSTLPPGTTVPKGGAQKQKRAGLD
ncbi:DUF2865 domain-containing protein [Bradyrhizobium sp. 2TAF24]|uniref:DUF2865 domain-containing protein n=1 Tax=Bradyrhizobium sp. 2TAF24 TaxID=3233011 RepID=UPI003F8E3EEB